MNQQKRGHIERQAEQILRDCGAYRVPVPIDLVAQHFNLKMEASGLADDISGVLVVENKRGAIGYNAMHASVRQRYTVPHEIGHYVLHVKKSPHSRLFIDRYVAYRRDDHASTGNEREEVEANAFAAALLMPARLVREEIKKHDFDLDDEEDLNALAKRFNVSASAMSYRLVNLGLLR